MMDCLHARPIGCRLHYCEACLSVENAKLLQLLAAERDAWGKRETEIMAKYAKLKAEVFDIREKYARLELISDKAFCSLESSLAMGRAGLEALEETT